MAGAIVALVADERTAAVACGWGYSSSRAAERTASVASNQHIFLSLV